MIRPEHQFYIRPDLRKAASTKAESAIRQKQLVRIEHNLTCPGFDSVTDFSLFVIIYET